MLVPSSFFCAMRKYFEVRPSGTTVVPKTGLFHCSVAGSVRHALEVERFAKDKVQVFLVELVMHVGEHWVDRG